MSPRTWLYFRDVLWLALISFGGPQAHLSLMHQHLVKRRGYFTESELLETNALCQMLPGPTSTQTLIVLSQKKWSVPVALLALLLWILPSAIVMTFVALLFAHFEARSVATDFLLFVQPMSIGVIAHSAYQLSLRFLRNNTAMMLMLLSLLIASSFPTPWTFPFIILGAAFVTNLTSLEVLPPPAQRAQINWFSSWFSLTLFVLLFMVSGALALLTKEKPFVLFENFYRFGALTFGGGSVLVPQMFEQFVQHRKYLEVNEFLSGLAICQALPGPTFSLATFMGAMVMKEDGITYLLVGSLIGTVGIFLPGTLLAFFVYPLWQWLKLYPIAQRSLEGIHAAAVGLILSAAIIMYLNMEARTMHIFVVVSTFLLLQYSRLKAPWLVLLALLAGGLYAQLF